MEPRQMESIHSSPAISPLADLRLARPLAMLSGGGSEATELLTGSTLRRATTRPIRISTRRQHMATIHIGIVLLLMVLLLTLLSWVMSVRSSGILSRG